MHDNTDLSTAFVKYVVVLDACQLRFYVLERGELQLEALESAGKALWLLV